MMSRTGAKGGREADPSDIEIEEGIGPVVETASDAAVGKAGGSQWCDEEEEAVTHETDPHAQDMARRLQSQEEGEMG